MARIGIALSNRSQLNPSRLVALVKEAEEMGFEVALMTESRNDGLACALAAASVTQRITIGTGIANIYLRHPVLLAMEALVIDDISQGRLLLGLGTGHAAFNENALGMKMGRPGTAVRECVEIVRRVASGETVNYEGSAFTIRGFTLGFRTFRAKFPIYISALRPKLAELAGEVADGVLYNLITPTFTRELNAAVERGARRVGRDPKDIEIASLMPCYVSNDRQAALRAAKDQILHYVGMPFYYGMLEQSGFAEEAAAAKQAWDKGGHKTAFDAISEAMARSLTLFGPPDECREQLDAYRQAGLSLPVLSPGAVGPDWEVSFRTALAAFKS